MQSLTSIWKILPTDPLAFSSTPENTKPYKEDLKDRVTDHIGSGANSGFLTSQLGVNKSMGASWVLQPLQSLHYIFTHDHSLFPASERKHLESSPPTHGFHPLSNEIFLFVQEYCLLSNFSYVPKPLFLRITAILHVD